jgi:hypothetical protein
VSAVTPRGEWCLVRELAGDELAELCQQRGLGALSMLVQTDAKRPVLVRIERLSAHHGKGVPDSTCSRLEPSMICILSTLSGAMHLPGGAMLVQERALAVAVDAFGTLHALGSWCVFEESEEAVAAFLGTSLTLPETVRTSGIVMKPEDASVAARAVLRAVPVRVTSAGPGHYQRYIRDVSPPRWGFENAGFSGLALVLASAAVSIWTPPGLPRRYFAPSPAIVGQLT